MQINLNNEEILSAIGAYVSEQGISTTGKDLSISIKAGRGNNGMSATVNITEQSEAKVPTGAIARDGADSSPFNSDADVGQD